MIERSEGSFTGEGGVRIAFQAWHDADAPALGALVISHGAGEHGGRYRYLVERLVPAGWSVHVADHRGHGRSEGSRGVIDRLANAVADLDAYVGRVRAEHPDLPLVLLGHSLGGCIAIEYALAHQDHVDALVLSSPAAALEAASPVERFAARLLSGIVPSLGVLPVDSAGISTDPDECAAYDQDPLVNHGKVPVRTVAEAAAAIETFEARAHAITLPLLVIHSRADAITPAAGSEMIARSVASEDCTLKLWDGLGHEMFNERAGARDEVIGEVMDWLAARFAPATA